MAADSRLDFRLQLLDLCCLLFYCRFWKQSEIHGEQKAFSLESKVLTCVDNHPQTNILLRTWPRRRQPRRHKASVVARIKWVYGQPLVKESNGTITKTMFQSHIQWAVTETLVQTHTYTSSGAHLNYWNKSHPMGHVDPNITSNTANCEKEMTLSTFKSTSIHKSVTADVPMSNANLNDWDIR